MHLKYVYRKEVKKMSNVHVVKKANHWETKKEGKTSPLTRHHTQEKAIEQGKKIILKSDGGELVIHGLDGKIRDKNTYVKKDSYPPKG